MDSINKNQTEHNHEDLNGAAGIQKIKHLVEKAESCFFTTAVQVSGSCGTRPMGVQTVDDQGNLWFLSASDILTSLYIFKAPLILIFWS
jgi:general stress protein 26